MRNESQMLKWLYSLRVLIIIEFILTIILIATSLKYWQIYFYINSALVLSYIWFNYIRLFYYETSQIKYPDSNEPYTVVVPTFNEEPRLLRDTISSLVATDNNKKQIIIIDDGSSNNIYKYMKELKNLSKDIEIYRFNKNKGKRYAHELAFKKSKYNFIVSIDSDTFICKNAIRRLLAPFVDKRVGATTGNILIKNEKENLLTRIQTGLYWVGLNIYKRGQSTQGNVVCCSGCLSAYRKSNLLEVLPEYISQTYLGMECRASEDRYLTNLMNERGLKVLYVDDSVCLTEAPTTLKKFIKQQLRWKRGFYRECLYTQTYAWQKSKVLYFENLLWLMFSPVIALPTVLISYYLILTNPLHFLIVALPFTILFSICRDSLFFIREPKRAFIYLSYIFLYLLIMYPLNIYAIFNTNPEKWGTR